MAKHLSSSTVGRTHNREPLAIVRTKPGRDSRLLREPAASRDLPFGVATPVRGKGGG